MEVSLTIKTFTTREDIEYMVRNQDKCLKMVGEKEYFRLLNMLIDAEKEKVGTVIKAPEYFKLGTDM